MNSLFDSLRSNGDSDPDHTRPADEYLRNTMNYVPTKRAKRTRTVSPTSAKRDLEAKRLERERQKKERWEQELQARRQQRESQFLREVYNEIPDLPMPGRIHNISLMGIDSFLTQMTHKGHKKWRVLTMKRTKNTISLPMIP